MAVGVRGILAAPDVLNAGGGISSQIAALRSFTSLANLRPLSFAALSLIRTISGLSNLISGVSAIGFK
jgi:hypothetical protein